MHPFLVSPSTTRPSMKPKANSLCTAVSVDEVQGPQLNKKRTKRQSWGRDKNQKNHDDRPYFFLVMMMRMMMMMMRRMRMTVCKKLYTKWYNNQNVKASKHVFFQSNTYIFPSHLFVLQPLPLSHGLLFRGWRGCWNSLNSWNLLSWGPSIHPLGGWVGEDGWISGVASNVFFFLNGNWRMDIREGRWFGGDGKGGKKTLLVLHPLKFFPGWGHKLWRFLVWFRSFSFLFTGDGCRWTSR